MFGWLGRMWDWASGKIDDTVRSWIRDLINGLYGFLHLIFGDVGKAWDGLVHAVWLAWHAVVSFMDETALTLYHLIKIVIPDVIKAWKLAVALADKYAHDLYHWALAAFDAVYHYVRAAILDVTRWVLANVYDPLKSFFDQAWHWITHEGATVWYYITHPAALVDLIWDDTIAKLEREAWNAGAKLGKFFLALVVRNLHAFALLIEDILNAVF